jgi:hypothetical protein
MDVEATIGAAFFVLLAVALGASAWWQKKHPIPDEDPDPMGAWVERWRGDD